MESCELERSVLPLLRSGLFHVTGPAGYKGIRESGFIQPSFGIPVFPNAGNSFARSNDYVALFDFRDLTDTMLEGVDPWKSYFPPYGSSLAIALEVDRTRLGDALVPNSVAWESQKQLFMPYYEAWSSRPIPWDIIKGAFIYVRGCEPCIVELEGGKLRELDELLIGIEMNSDP